MNELLSHREWGLFSGGFGRCYFNREAVLVFLTVGQAPPCVFYSVNFYERAAIPAV